MNALLDYKNELEHTNEPETTLQAGQVLDGKYRVDHLLGQGGMAAVWASTNERTGKHVALKVLLPSLTATPGVHSLFHREALAASRVNHPNVVTVFDVIQHQGTACIVMELLTGESLDRYLARNVALTVNDVCGLLLPAMLGVAAAHGQGVIHRDLKPQNIFVCLGPDGRPVTTKVLDFGISIIVERARDPVAGQALNGMMGTPAYMAPEQVMGTSPIDERTDVYGFGVLFYESLTGRVPFLGDPGAALYERIVLDPVPPLTQLRPDLRPGLVQIIETALAKEPAQRYPSLDQMVAALEWEMLPATPALGVPMLAAAAPSGIVVDAASASQRISVEPVLRREASGAHLATKMLVGFPLQTEGPRRTEKLPAHRWWLHSHRVRTWASVGAALLIAGGAFAWRSLSNSDKQAQESLPLLMLQNGAPTSASTVKPIVEQLAPAALDESNAASTPSVGDAAALGDSRMAAPGSGKDVKVHRPDSRGSVGRSPLSPRAAKSRASAGSVRPRAGNLSAEDF